MSRRANSYQSIKLCLPQTPSTPPSPSTPTHPCPSLQTLPVVTHSPPFTSRPTHIVDGVNQTHTHGGSDKHHQQCCQVVPFYYWTWTKRNNCTHCIKAQIWPIWRRKNLFGLLKKIINLNKFWKLWIFKSWRLSVKSWRIRCCEDYYELLKIYKEHNIFIFIFIWLQEPGPDF